MAKTKNKKRNLADAIHTKKESMHSKKALNPFEVHINKEKMTVLGRKVKNDRGLPGVSRAKAIKKRKGTLLQEYKVQNKSNKFVDRRIGERNRDMTEEDKVIARFTAIRKKSHNKKSIFNLAEDEVLTHRGQVLSEIEKFDDPRSDDDEDSLDGSKKTGNLEASFVGDAHFGGGVLKKTGHEGVKTHKELIDQLISESKKRKAEKQKTKEATLELTEKLDTEWKDLMPLISSSNKKEDVVAEKPKVDDYDKVMRELRFEARGTVSDRLKTEDEMAKEEREKLENLEKERLERMKGFDKESANDKSNKQNHRSADDLDDDFNYESDPEYMLSYNKEGESNLDVDAQLNGKNIGEDQDDDKVQESENDENEDDKSEQLETESEDDLSDLKAESSEESEEEQEMKPVDKDNEDCKQEESSTANLLETKLKDDLQKRKESMEKAREELPYTFSLPDSYESLQELFDNHSSDQQNVILERMIKCNHPSLGEGNKGGLGNLFAYILQYLNDLAIDSVDEASVQKCFDAFAALAPKMFELAHINPENAHNCVREVIKEKHEEFRKKTKGFPGIEILLFLKLISLLFSTSDFKHQVVTPCFIFIEQMLNKCRVKSKKDISYGIFLIAVLLEYTTLSKRYLPAAINFLGGLLHMAVPKFGVKLIKVRPPFKSTSNDLVLVEDFSSSELNLKMECTDLVGEELDEIFKIRCIATTLGLIEEFASQFENLPSNVEIFNDINVYLQLLPNNNYPESVKNNFEVLIRLLENQKKNRQLDFIVTEAKRPKALRLYEPKIVEVFDGKQRKVQSKEKAERDKLAHKLKKETKGALREIRRDKAFLGGIKIKHMIQSDKERRDKVKRIYAEASMQQSELNAIDRKKKKK